MHFLGSVLLAVVLFEPLLGSIKEAVGLFYLRCSCYRSTSY